MKLTQGYQNMFRIKELRDRIFFTAMILLVYRLGSHVPTPGVDAGALRAFFAGQEGTLLGLFNVFAGGNLANATIFAMGIMPYINASIILQLLQAVWPPIERLAKEGEEGRQKIQQYTRYGTVMLATVQAAGISIALERLTSPIGTMVVPDPGLLFKFTTVLTLVTGTVFVMWLGEQITERGIGNGISLIITIGILAMYPNDLFNSIQQLQTGVMSPFKGLLLLIFMLGIIAVIVSFTQAVRRIPVQHAKKMVGRKMYGGNTSHLPLKVNTAGVIPIIFAQAIIMFPATVASFMPNNELMIGVANLFRPGGWIYITLYAVIVVFFSYFYTAVVLNPVDLADNMKKYGGFIPGIRPGKRTAEYIDRVLTRITLPGSVFLAAIAILPDVLIARANVPFYFGGTGLLIVVAVGLDTMQQVESHLLMRNYDGFMKRGKLRGRR